MKSHDYSPSQINYAGGHYTTPNERRYITKLLMRDGFATIETFSGENRSETTWAKRGPGWFLTHTSGPGPAGTVPAATVGFHFEVLRIEEKRIDKLNKGRELSGGVSFYGGGKLATVATGTAGRSATTHWEKLGGDWSALRPEYLCSETKSQHRKLLRLSEAAQSGDDSQDRGLALERVEGTVPADPALCKHAGEILAALVGILAALDSDFTDLALAKEKARLAIADLAAETARKK